PCGNYSTNTLNIIIAPGTNVLFRIYAWGNTSGQSAGTFRIDDIVFSGTSNPPANNFKFYDADPRGGMANLLHMGSEYDPMTSPATSPQSIWVTQCTSDGCESIPTEVVITVSINPSIVVPDVDPVCEPASFNINDFTFGENPVGGTFSYHDTQSDAEMGINPILSGLDNINVARTIFIRYELSNGCYAVEEMTFIIYPMPPPPDVPAEV